MPPQKRKSAKSQKQLETTLDDLIDRVRHNTVRQRERCRWTQEETARECGMPLRQYQQVEAGVNATLKTLARLSDGFGIDARDLLKQPRRARSLDSL